jgi:oxygen-independent coproporphyrinogen-3 oxidase
MECTHSRNAKRLAIFGNLFINNLKLNILAGIYVHIPFCRQACHYCDFHFSTNLKLKNELFDCMLSEIMLQNSYLEGEDIQSIYLGGGTPSLLSLSQLEQLLEKIRLIHPVSHDTEITIECNPDDISSKLMSGLERIGVNRISLGVQTFHNNALKFLNRIHNADEAINSIEIIQESALSNFSIDLIYAIPRTDMNHWKADLQKALSFQPPHISAYGLTIEENTVFGSWYKNQKIKPLEEELAAQQYEYLMEVLTENGYDQYEISNFAKQGYYSRHNINYWKHGKFLGIGPGAHSFNGTSRQFNVRNNPGYIREIRKERVPYEYIPMTADERANEYILTSLRTSWGLEPKYLMDHFEIDLLKTREKEILRFVEAGFLRHKEDHIQLTTKGKLLADQISSDLFI